MSLAARFTLFNKMLPLLMGLGMLIGFQLTHTHKTLADSPSITYVAGTLTQSQTWSPDSIYVIYDNTVIPNGITLTVQPGTIIKMKSLDGTLRVMSGGAFVASGSASDPIYFTSINDDSVGGDTASNGPTAGAIGDYDTAIDPEGGDISINHAKFRYGRSEIRDNQVLCQAENISILDTSFSDAQLGVSLSCYPSLVLQRNVFSSVSAYVTSNDLTGIPLDGSDTNIFTGTNARASLGVTGKVPANAIWNIDSSAVKIIQMNGVRVSGTINVNPGVFIVAGGSTDIGVEIGNGGALNLNHGVVVKTIWESSIAFRVNGGGDLEVDGISNDPVIFTSYKDDSVGGDTLNDGPTAGTVGDYSNVIDIEGEGGSANINHGTFKYARQAIIDGMIICGNEENMTINNSQLTHLQSAIGLRCGNNLQITNTNFDQVTNYVLGLGVNQANLQNISITNSNLGLSVGRGKVVFRGTFNNIADKFITACNWSTSNCMVDAAYVDWGNTTGHQNKICGQITASPWLYNGQTHTEDLFGSPNCDGAPTPYENLNSKIAGFSQRTNQYSLDCSNGLQDACQAFDRAYRCLSGAMQAAQSTSPWPLPAAGTAQQVAQFGELARTAASDYMTAQAIVSPSGFGLSFFNQLFGTVGTIVQLANAYGSCA